MSVAASGRGMSGSDDDNGAEEKKGKGISEIPDDHLPSTDGDTDDEGDEKEVESKAKRRSTLDCLASLESSLPMKRGLSSHYYGRSKSFGNLTEMGMEESKDLGKKEHAVNKRRRLLIAHEFHEKSVHGGASSNITHTSSSAPAFLSDHPKNEDEEDDNKDEKKGNDDHKNQEEDGK